MSTITPHAAAPSDIPGPGIPEPDLSGPDVADVGTRTGASDLDSVTGPLPVIDLDDGHLHVCTRRDVTIVEIDGGLDHTLAGSIVPSLDDIVAGASAVVLDLDRVTLLDRKAVDAVCAVLDRLPGDSRCIVAGRLSSRLVLDRWGVPVRYAVFTSVADALQAREFVASGYGTGWALDA